MNTNSSKHIIHQQAHNNTRPILPAFQWLNPILLRRVQKLILPESQSQPSHPTEPEQIDNTAPISDLITEHSSPNERMLATLLTHMEQLGYTFDHDLLQACRTLPVTELIALHQQIVPTLQHMVGDHVKYKPMYPNFPDEVMEASHAQLYLNAMLHYSLGTLPDSAAQTRPLLLDNTQLRFISLAEESAGIYMMRNLAAANGSLSEQDKEDLRIALHHVEDVEQLLPEQIPYKENAAYVAAVLLDNGRASIQRLSGYFRTATDVLRLAAGLSGLDTSLAWAKKLPQLTRPFANVYNMNQGMNVQVNHTLSVNGDKQAGAADPATAYHFRKFKRSERRLLLGLLECTVQPLEDMVLYREQWKRLGEILHPGEMRKQYPNAFAAFTSLRRDKHIVTFRSEIQHGLANGDPAVIAKLGTRPGELARRLDMLLRSQPQRSTAILEQFEQHMNELSTPLLLQMMAHFKHRHEPRRYRVFFPKGNMGKVVAIPNTLPVLSDAVTERLTQGIEHELRRRFAEQPSLGRVYIEPTLQQIPVPLSQRSVSRALRALPRGSRVDMLDGDTVRLFCWWSDLREGQHTRVDVDLSVILMDDNWNHVDTLAFYNIKADFGVHSGDIVSAPQGASEFIDLHIPAVLAQTRARYAVVQVNCFTGQAFAELPECFAGFMMRQHVQTGEVYDPRTVQSKFDLTVQAQQAVPFALDLHTREMIWMDAVLKNRSFQITAQDNMTGLQMLGHAFSDLRRPMLSELFTLHAQARGTLVERMEDADTIFAMEQGITPYETDMILAEFM
ncbi:cytoplasmic protein [Paenibacillus sp. WLX1005]|uniref:cytoplasmic protein n=1 Tax=Paenibacillus sp. WLX1005 TaxID=3243766 RepID=UPI0039841213